MKYVMSDLHGCYDEFIKMLKLINFGEDDEIFILGDIFDRGNKPLEILDYIVSHKNIHLIKGNHEKFFEEFYESGDAQLWYYNGGKTTYEGMVHQSHYFSDALYLYIKKLPYIKVVDKFILAHAGVYFPENYEELTIDEFIKLQEEDFCLWDRSNIDNEKRFKDYTIIVGHTPVQAITNSCDNVKIIHKDGTIYIDCGCVFEKANGKLACLCLDTMEEFYI